MPAIIATDRNGDTATIEARTGVSLMEILRDDGGFDIMAICGGVSACATCHVYVDPAWLHKCGAISDDEQDLLESADHRQPNSRLSCQIEISEALDGMKVTVVPE